ncbi:Uncharacterized conserved protein, DUF302 family [Cognatiyoonia koreensis]|uniref:Uncharacterized conserved protein, DUF302 family n=1 Tax=Cognatiyoonia koreensis TaxID=364200 RepID=A0A1I0RMJ7_9RHOB|nr:DUF302 domain-containing protein [Cognatiyoonia koreensis]SEW42245.1 Uncharacterized conserved protein, DUF302 family [Cognatiyoonia koreensis]
MYKILAVFFIFIAGLASAENLQSRDGWVVLPSDKSFDILLEDLKSQIGDSPFAIVTQASPTVAAASRGITIPNNRVIGVFNNVYAVRILDLSTAAMIEAPIRFYVTENMDSTATLSYKSPTFVFGPYMDEAGQDLAAAAAELDAAFEMIANAAVE